MSVPVAIGDLQEALEGFGAGYLLSNSEGRVKAVTVEPEVSDDGMLMVRDPGGGSRRNVAANPVVTLLFPPLQERGYTLLVDGTASVEGDDVRVTPSGAVLHRPAAHADGPVEGDGGCGHDCAPVG
ncbi:pyridoxamine 5'-phosphate oxidase [Nocardioides nanhaiensis]|uniref:Pyridoxamine 5'-phosphate oxidase n=1 Tax=Nocardioides nanhaiensis TaxID=1476871 RepID=A0ABP8VZT2_9ACTN